MPCNYHGSPEQDEIHNLREELNIRERMLCAICTSIDDTEGKKMLKIILRRAASEAKGLETKDITKWWKNHKKSDKK